MNNRLLSKESLECVVSSGLSMALLLIITLGFRDNNTKQFDINGYTVAMVQNNKGAIKMSIYDGFFSARTCYDENNDGILDSVSPLGTLEIGKNGRLSVDEHEIYKKARKAFFSLDANREQK